MTGIPCDFLTNYFMINYFINSFEAAVNTRYRWIWFIKKKKCFKWLICMNNFVVIVFGVFQLVLLFHFSISVCTITTLKSHTEKNDECCFIEWSGISFDNILGRCNVVLKSGVVETVVAPSLYPSCLYAHHWISIQKQQNSARLRFMENTH